MQTKKDLKELIKYRLSNIFDHDINLSKEEIENIKRYINKVVVYDLSRYKMVIVDDKTVGCLLVKEVEDIMEIEKIYLIEKYRSKGIGTNIIKTIQKQNKAIKLLVFKNNSQAINLYKRLNFIIIGEKDNRYY